MEMVIIPADQLRTMMIEAASIALKYNPPSIASSSVEPDELLTPEETAQFLKVSKVTVWDWSRRGILSPRRIGNQVRYLKSELLAAARPKGGKKI
ncbi:helix-turn-helix domain-containing protein [Larkinella terrae]|uniref:Helix-turn-helix domain-containing protein n=1 Tax=Larkinella terrae TaxID=2025311 RepID=A0A7K0EHL9_9BACT|nr:helix-turn-helix domain-containing protein [Larkinella terrae]MRS61212.1 helix-turn-helix domain-containing protein [Larkinella terrae]